MEKKLVDEWANSDAGRYVRLLVEKEYHDISETPVSDCLTSGNPFETHEAVVELETRERCWGEFAEILSGNLETIEEVKEESDETDES